MLCLAEVNIHGGNLVAELAISHVCRATWEVAHNGIGRIDFPTSFHNSLHFSSSIIFPFLEEKGSCSSVPQTRGCGFIHVLMCLEDMLQMLQCP